jgi:hypothetical protein
MAVQPSDSSRNQADLEVITRALPFQTIPDEPLRAHFARWLLNSLATSDRLGPFPSVEPETPPAAAPFESTADIAPQTAPPELPSETATRPEPSSRTATRPGIATRPAPASAANRPETLPETAKQASRRTALLAPPSAATDAAAPEPAPPDDPLGYGPLPLEWQGPPAPPRPQFVRQRDGTVWLTKPILRTRGWTDSAVRDFLPEPEGLKPNPRFASTAPMPVWRPATVAAAEAGPEWQAWLERSLQRRRTTLEALAETEDADFRARMEAARAAIEAERGASR